MKKWWFQLHWFVGITAGLVLAVIGLTGALLSYEEALTKLLSPGVATVPVRHANRLMPDALYAAVQAAVPERRILQMGFSSTPGDAVEVRLSGEQGSRGETFYADPYTGQLLGKSAADGVFLFIMRVHRFLAMDAVGKQITAASTVLLLLMALTGLYLRWPRRIGHWRAWLHIDFKKTGRGFLWNLHAVIGTIVLVPYLLSSLTGLYWSYDWYRAALFKIAGVPQPVRAKPVGEKVNERAAGKRTPLSSPNLSAAWAAFTHTVPAYAMVSIRMPDKPKAPLQLSYLTKDSLHERAWNRLNVDAKNGEILSHELWAEKTAGSQFMGSIFALHRGSFFGQPGVIVIGLASLTMPVFFVTGWMLYLDRRKKRRGVKAHRAAPAGRHAHPSLEGRADDGVLIGYASQSGVAEGLAWQTADLLQGAGIPTQIHPLAGIGAAQLGAAKRALFIVSTFGDGEPPDSARRFARQWMHRAIALPSLNFAMLSLGDSHYERFCGFGRQLDGWLRAQGGVAAFDPVEVDRGDPGALTHWQAHLGEWLGRSLTGSVTNTAPALVSWTLVERKHLNPGSQGGPVFHLAFAPPAGMTWTAGDWVEVQPCLAMARVDAFLAASAWPADTCVTVGQQSMPLAKALRERVLPDALPPAQTHLQRWFDTLARLPMREYSIASTPAEGQLKLLVRQTTSPDGTLGVGSGWLTAYAAVGDTVTLRVRPNLGFRGTDNDAPVILIGNGTGLAGLRAHLVERIQAGRYRNWLIFGERNEAHDLFHADELRDYLSRGQLARADWVFSRDQAERRYVQHRVREVAEELRAWVADGATIFVCGSLDGMAPGVDEALAEVLGRDALADLAANGRYHRDIY